MAKPWGLAVILKRATKKQLFVVHQSSKIDDFQCHVLLNLCWIICILLKQTAIHHVHVFRHIWPEEQGTQCIVLLPIPGGCMTRLWTSSSNRVTRRLSWIITPSVSTSWDSACEQYPLLYPLMITSTLLQSLWQSIESTLKKMCTLDLQSPWRLSKAAT